jgi:hypothetical protein
MGIFVLLTTKFANIRQETYSSCRTSVHGRRQVIKRKRIEEKKI